MKNDFALGTYVRLKRSINRGILSDKTSYEKAVSQFKDEKCLRSLRNLGVSIDYVIDPLRTEASVINAKGLAYAKARFATPFSYCHRSHLFCKSSKGGQEIRLKSLVIRGERSDRAFRFTRDYTFRANWLRRNVLIMPTPRGIHGKRSYIITVTARMS